MARFVYLCCPVRLGPYQTLVDLGRGGMADLYVARAVDPIPRAANGAPPTNGGGMVEAPSPLVILKTLRAPLSKQRVEMFNDEATLALLFDHPNVVQSFSAGEDAGRYYIALEYLDGQSVDRVIHRVVSAGRTDARNILLYILGRALGGLHYAHDLARDGVPLLIVHRDFTPQNLFVTYDGRIKALDFGIAKAQGRVSRTTTGEVKGKIRYMAPEQALSLRIDRRADIFAAGIMLWEFCRNGLPFWRSELTEKDIFEELVSGNYPTELPTETPAINAILRKALARDACERYRTADEMRVDLLTELGRSVPLSQLAAMTASFVSELFQDQRERTARMLAHAENPNQSLETLAARRGV
jgi:eukaryotic-like serine/threonine-protein kinase